MATKTSFRPVRKAVFPVAGLGTRFLPATKVMPKEMLTVGDRPLIQHTFEEAREAGIEEFLFITGRHKELLEEHFDHQPELMQTLEARGRKDLLEKVKSSEMPEGRLFLTRQPKPLGLGHAVWCARKLVGDEPFAVFLTDDLILNPGGPGCMAQMVSTYNETGGNVIAVMDVPKEDTSKYGVIAPGKTAGKAVEVKGLVEKPAAGMAPSTLAVIGRYILQPDVFNHLGAFEKGAGGEIQLTDALAKMTGTQPFHGLRFDGTRFDCGSRLGFIEANIAYGLHDTEIGASVSDIVAKYADLMNGHAKTVRIKK